MKQVVWMLESSKMSGGVRVIYEYAKRLSKHGYQSTFFSLDDSPDWFDANFIWRKFYSYQAMLEPLSQLDCPVFATWWRTAYFLQEAQAKKPCYLIQDIESEYYSALAQRQYVEETYNFGFQHVIHSHWVEKWLIDHNQNCDYVGIGLRYRNFMPTSTKRERKVLSIARPQALKGFSYLGETIRRLSRDLAMPTETMSVIKNIRFHGLHTHSYNLSDRSVIGRYQKSRYFITTSRHEGFGLGNLEAMAAGCCVVTTDCDGVHDYAVHEHNCLIVNRDDPREMVAALTRLEKDKELRQRLITNGLDTVKSWGWEEPIKRLVSLLDKM